MAGITLSFRASLTPPPVIRARVAVVMLAMICLAIFGPVAVATDSDPIREAHERFLAALTSGDGAAAVEHAAETLRLSEEKHGPQAREVVNPLTNLGTAAFRQGDFERAEQAYLRAIGIIDGQLAGADRMLIRPLHGLGETLLARARPDDAAIPLKRAVDLSRNLDGLFNIGQLDFLDPLIEAYVAANRSSEADREQQYAFRVAENEYGRNDLRLLEPLDRYARWFESIGRYSTARGLHARALQLTERLAADNLVLGVPALRGLARTWSLEYLYGPELEARPTAEISDGSESPLLTQQSARLSPEGERALRNAIDILRRSETQRLALADTWSQLGDWYLLTGNQERMNAAYLEAWNTRAAISTEALAIFATPRLVFYRAPSASSTRFKPSNIEEYEPKKIEVRLRIGRDGRVIDTAILSSEAAEAINRSVLFAARRARYAPRLEAGKAVEEDGLVLSEVMWVKIPNRGAKAD